MFDTRGGEEKYLRTFGTGHSPLMGIVRRTSLGRYALVESLSEDDDKLAEATDAPSEVEPMDIEVLTVVLGASSDPSPSSTWVHERLARL